MLVPMLNVHVYAHMHILVMSERVLNVFKFHTSLSGPTDGINTL